MQGSFRKYGEKDTFARYRCINKLFTYNEETFQLTSIFNYLIMS